MNFCFFVVYDLLVPLLLLKVVHQSQFSWVELLPFPLYLDELYQTIESLSLDSPLVLREHGLDPLTCNLRGSYGQIAPLVKEVPQL